MSEIKKLNPYFPQEFIFFCFWAEKQAKILRHLTFVILNTILPSYRKEISSSDSSQLQALWTYYL